MAAKVLAGELTQRGVAGAGRDSHLPETTTARQHHVLRNSLRLARHHLEKSGLRDDLDVGASGVQLLGLDLLAALLALAVQRRTFVADHQVMELRRDGLQGHAVGLLDLVFGLLALHGRQLAGEDERGALEIHLHSGFSCRCRLLRGEVRRGERLDHRLDGEVVIAFLAAHDQPHEPVEAEFRRRETTHIP